MRVTEVMTSNHACRPRDMKLAISVNREGEHCYRHRNLNAANRNEQATNPYASRVEPLLLVFSAMS